MVQCYTVINFSILLLYFAVDLLQNFGLFGIHAAISNNVTCYACPKGTLGNNSLPDCHNCSNKGWCENTTSCHKCPSGHYQNVTGQTNCFPCPVGYYQKNPGQDVCHPCVAGEHQDSPGQDVCHPCEAGEHQDSPGEAECKKCPKGFYSLSQGSQRCISCGLGGFCNELGCTACKPCPAGKEAGNMGSKNCTLCQKGYFKQSIGFITCQLCKRGWYQIYTGQTNCHECPRGSYCPWQDGPPILCDPNQLCPPGSHIPGTECNVFERRNKDTGECDLSSIVYAVIGVTLTVVLAGIGFVLIRRYRRQNEQRQRLLERQHPVYTGW